MIQLFPMRKRLLLPGSLFCILVSQAQTGASFMKGKKFYQEENYTEAIQYFTRAADEEPANPQVPYFTGRAYLDMGNYRQAVAFLEKAISMDSSHSNWMYECGLVYYAI